MILPLCQPTYGTEWSSSLGTTVQAPKLTKVHGVHLEQEGVGTIYFTINIPSSYGKAIEAIRITQILSGNEPIDFAANQSQVVLGEHVTRNSVQVPLSSIGGSEDSETGAFTLAFTQPVEPGTTITVAIAAERNPLSGGLHQFGITAYPLGEGNTGLYLGTARITFFEDN